jgi:hypothetical protein
MPNQPFSGRCPTSGAAHIQKITSSSRLSIAEKSFWFPQKLRLGWFFKVNHYKKCSLHFVLGERLSQSKAFPWKNIPWVMQVGKGLEWIVSGHGQVRFLFSSCTSIDCKALKKIFHHSNPCKNWYACFQLFIISFGQKRQTFLLWKIWDMDPWNHSAQKKKLLYLQKLNFDCIYFKIHTVYFFENWRID